MAFDEGSIYDRMNSAEAKVATMQQNNDHLKKEIQGIREVFGIKGTVEDGYKIDYQKLVEGLGLEQAFSLRQVIDEHYRISGAPGEKPKVSISA